MDGQQQQRPQQRQPLARLVGAVVVGDPQRGEQQAPGRRVQGARRARDGAGRRVHRLAARPVHEEDRERAVHQGHRAAPARDAARVT